MTMQSRNAVLGRIRTALAGHPSPELPPSHPVWPRTAPSPAAMAERFTQELTNVHGEVVRAANIDEARQKLAELAAAGGWDRVAMMDRPLARDVAAGLGSKALLPAPGWEARDMADIAAAVVEPEFLLADTGSSAVVCHSGHDRLLCYLPPNCVIVATIDRLRENLPTAWDVLGPMAAEPDRRGEFVLITGPSRTSDIEKILILGVHGPMRLVVLLVG